MKILITGSSGFIGSSLVSFFEKKGDTVHKLVRRAPETKNQFLWSPREDKIDKKSLEGIDVVIHLAGENVLGLWTKKKKEAILLSRTKSTALLAETMSQMENPPKLWISTSAAGFYGDRGSQWVDENSEQGAGFLAKVCHEWEQAVAPAEAAGIRVVKMRVGIVLGQSGGPLKKMLLPFKLGLGGRLGSGKQYMSWIAIDDIVGIVNHCIENENISGVVNACAPNPVTNLEFTKTLGSVLRRPTIFPIPALPVKMIFPEMSREFFFSSTRVQPKVIQDKGYTFVYSSLRKALEELVK